MKQPTEWEKIFPNVATNKGLSPKYSNSSWSSIIKKKWPNPKMGGRSKETFLKKTYRQPKSTWKDAQHH